MNIAQKCTFSIRQMSFQHLDSAKLIVVSTKLVVRRKHKHSLALKHNYAVTFLTIYQESKEVSGMKIMVGQLLTGFF